MDAERNEGKEAFHAAMRELEQHQTTCTNKGKFLDNVVHGREPITFAVIDRCRESALQLKQAHHVFVQLHKRHVDNSLADATVFTKMLSDNQAAVDKVDADLAIILAWVPPAPG